MQLEILDSGAFASAMVHLDPDDQFVSESGAMFRASSNVDIDVTTRSRGKGGVLSGLKRLLAKENFFMSTYRVTDGHPGEVGLAPTHQGELRVIDIDESTGWVCSGGSYLGSTPGLALDTQFQGLRGLLTGEAMFFMKVSGVGQCLVSAFGRIAELNVKQAVTVDSGHLVAFQEGLEYTVTKAGGSWVQSWLAGEGVVLNFTGTGRILVQSHNPTDFGKSLGPKLPPRN